MFCRECGEKLPDGSKFCPKCGAKQENDSASSSTPELKAESPKKGIFQKKIIIGSICSFVATGVGLVAVLFPSLFNLEKKSIDEISIKIESQSDVDKLYNKLVDYENKIVKIKLTLDPKLAYNTKSGFYGSVDNPNEQVDFNVINDYRKLKPIDDESFYNLSSSESKNYCVNSHPDCVASKVYTDYPVVSDIYYIDGDHKYNEEIRRIQSVVFGENLTNIVHGIFTYDGSGDALLKDGAYFGFLYNGSSKPVELTGFTYGSSSYEVNQKIVNSNYSDSDDFVTVAKKNGSGKPIMDEDGYPVVDSTVLDNSFTIEIPYDSKNNTLYNLKVKNVYARYPTYEETSKIKDVPLEMELEGIFFIHPVSTAVSDKYKKLGTQYYFASNAVMHPAFSEVQEEMAKPSPISVNVKKIFKIEPLSPRELEQRNY